MSDNGGLPLIPVLRPCLDEEERQAVLAVLDSGWLGLGPHTAEFEKALTEFLGQPACVAVNSGTAALHLALSLLDLQPGDEVIVPTITFVSTAHAVLYAGGIPVFADVEANHLTLDSIDVQNKITGRTRAIVPVHMAGHPADLDLLRECCGNNIAVVEDAAHAFGARYKGKLIGSDGDYVCFSFHAVKNLTCGEGGAIIGSLLDAAAVDRLRRLRWLGISRDTWDRSKSMQRYAWEYDVTELGFKCHPSDVLMAIGLVQLAKVENANAGRRRIAAVYNAAFTGLPWLQTPTVAPWALSSWHLYQVRLADACTRNRFIEHLAQHNVGCGVHYFPIHMHPYYRQKSTVRLPVAEQEWERLVTLPLYPCLTEKEIDRVISAVRSFRG